jgi:hypothetical protein
MIPCPADSVVGPGQANLFSLIRRQRITRTRVPGPRRSDAATTIDAAPPVGARLRLFRGGARPSLGGAPRDEARRIAA